MISLAKSYLFRPLLQRFQSTVVAPTLGQKDIVDSISHAVENKYSSFNHFDDEMERVLPQGVARAGNSSISKISDLLTNKATSYQYWVSRCKMSLLLGFPIAKSDYHRIVSRLDQLSANLNQVQHPEKWSSFLSKLRMQYTENKIITSPRFMSSDDIRYFSKGNSTNSPKSDDPFSRLSSNYYRPVTIIRYHTDNMSPLSVQEEGAAYISKYFSRYGEKFYKHANSRLFNDYKALLNFDPMCPHQNPTTTFNKRLLRRIQNTNDEEKLAELLSVAFNKDAEPGSIPPHLNNDIIYAALLKCVEWNNLDLARGIYDRLIMNGGDEAIFQCVDIRVFQNLIALATSKSDLSMVQSLLTDMRYMGIDPSPIVFYYISRLALYTSSVDEALHWYERANRMVNARKTPKEYARYLPIDRGIIVDSLHDFYIQPLDGNPCFRLGKDDHLLLIGQPPEASTFIVVMLIKLSHLLQNEQLKMKDQQAKKYEDTLSSMDNAERLKAKEILDALHGTEQASSNDKKKRASVKKLEK